MRERLREGSVQVLALGVGIVLDLSLPPLRRLAHRGQRLCWRLERVFEPPPDPDWS